MGKRSPFIWSQYDVEAESITVSMMNESAVSPEYRLDDAAIAGLLADLERNGSAGYVAEFPMIDADGIAFAQGRATVTLLSHGWKKD